MRIEISLKSQPNCSYLEPVQVHWCKTGGERQCLKTFAMTDKAKALEFCRSIASYPDDEIIDLTETNLSFENADFRNKMSER